MTINRLHHVIDGHGTDLRSDEGFHLDTRFPNSCGCCEDSNSIFLPLIADINLVDWKLMTKRNQLVSAFASHDTRHTGNRLCITLGAPALF